MVLLANIRFAAAKKGPAVEKALRSFIGPFQPAAQMKLEDYDRPVSVGPTPPFHPCSVFFDRTLSRFISKGQRKGQRAMMRDMMRETFAIIKRSQLTKWNGCANAEERAKIECDPLVIFHGAMENCRPLLITRPVKRGGATYQVPFPISEKESEELAMRWLFETVKERPKPRKQHFPEVMARELIDCYYNDGKVVKRKQDMHRQCETNKAYAHYRWG